MRTAGSWIIGILAFFITAVALEYVTHELGIPTYIDYGDPLPLPTGAGAEEIDTETDIGASILCIAAMLAYRVGKAVKTGSLTGHFGEADEIDFRAWLQGFICIVVGAGILHFAFQGIHESWTNYARYVVTFGFALLVWRRMTRWRDRKIARLEARKRPIRKM
jgi:hypothetical protein